MVFIWKKRESPDSVIVSESLGIIEARGRMSIALVQGNN